MDICRAAKRQGKRHPLVIDPFEEFQGSYKYGREIHLYYGT